MAMRSLAVAIALWVAAISQAVVTQGNPYNITGTGTPSGTYTACCNPSVWIDNNIQSGGYLAVSDGDGIVYREEWGAAQAIGSFIIDVSDRACGGEIWVATKLGGPCDTKLTTFQAAQGWQSIMVNVVPRKVYGVEIRVNKGTICSWQDESAAAYYQIGEVSIFSRPLGENLALGMPTVRNDTTQYWLFEGSVTDSSLLSAWRADATADANWVGFVVPDGGTIDVTHLRVVSAAMHAPQGAWTWRDFDVQIMKDGQWVDEPLIRAAITPGEDICWIDFGQTLRVQGIRLYGSVAGLNNPIVSDAGLIIDEIAAFYIPIPEPATMALLAMGGLALLRRR